MKKTAVVFVALIAILAVAPSAFAQGGVPEKAPINTTTLALAVGFAWLSQHLAEHSARAGSPSAACEGIARNPGAAGISVRQCCSPGVRRNALAVHISCWGSSSTSSSKS